MSCDGIAIGAPCAGDRMLLLDSISTEASIWASGDSGMWTAIWSPSKSALNAVQTSGWMRIALPSTSTGSNAWIPRRWSVGARVSSTGGSAITSSRTSPTPGVIDSTYFFAALMFWTDFRSTSRLMMNGLKSSSAISFGRPHWCSFSVGAGTPTRAAGVVDALAEQVLAEAALLALEHVGQRLQRPVARAGDGAATAAVVEQRVDGLLQHALLVVDDDLRRAEVEQPLEAVVPVDDAAVEVVQVRRGEA